MSATPASGPIDRPEWFYLRNRQKAGPFSLAQMQRLLETGELQPDDLVLGPGAEVWAAVSAVPDLAPPAWQPTAPPAITTTPGLTPVAAPAPADWRGPEPSVRRGGFWHWYRTHPGLVALLVVGLLLLAVLPVMTVLVMLRYQAARAEMQAARAMAAAQATLAEAQAVQEEMHFQDAQRELKRAMTELQKQMYADNIFKAHQAWKNKDLAAAGELLDQTDEKSRGWEYSYLRRLVALGPGAAECRTLPEQDSPVHAVAFDLDGRVLATAAGSADRPGVVRLWELDGKREPRILKGPAGLIGCLAFSPDGKQLATGSSDRSVKIWNIESGEVQLSLAGHAGPVTSVVFSLDGEELVSVGGGTIKVWRCGTGEEAIKLEDATGSYVRAAFNPQEPFQLAAASLDGTVKLWDRRNGKVQQALGKRQDKPPSSALFCYHPCGDWLAVAGLDVKVWETRKPKLGPETPSWGAERGPFRAIVFPDLNRLATGSADGAIRLWHPFTGKELLCLTGHRDAVTVLAFSPDSQRLVSASADGSVKVWEAAPVKK